MAGVTTFAAFGNNFQTRLLQAIVTDSQFFEKMYDILQPEYFPSDPHRELWLTIKDFYEKHTKIPTLESVKVEVATYEDSVKDEAKLIVGDIERKTSPKYAGEVEQAKEKSFEFCRNKSMEQAILDCVALLKKNKFDAIQQRVEDALRVSADINLGHMYFDELEARTHADVRRFVPTGIPILDNGDYLSGGLGAGELGSVMGESGIGKSFFLVNIGYGALTQGFNVVYYTLELSEVNVGLRFDSRISGIPTKEIPSRVKEVDDELKSFSGGRLVIKEYPTDTPTINTFRFHIGRLASSGFKPDVVLVDYADLMSSRKRMESLHLELSEVYKDLRQLANELGVPVWTVTQSNRSGYGEQVLRANSVAGSIGKIPVLDFFATMSDKEFFIEKNRIGYAKRRFPLEMDLSKSLIEVGDEITGPIAASMGSTVSSEVDPSAMKKVVQAFKDKKGLTR